MGTWAKLQALVRRRQTWDERYAEFLTPDRAYTDFETKRLMYRGAPYCLNCKAKVMSYGSFCADCKDIDTVKVPEPMSPAEQAKAWDKLDRMAEERRKDEQKS